MSLKTQKVVGDLGSQEVAQLVHSYNHLLDTLDTLIDSLTSAGNIGDVNTAATTALASLEANSYKIEAKPSIPLAPAPPAV